MSSTSIFPSANLEFNAYLQIVVPYLTANAARLGISAADAAAIVALLVLWNPVYAQTENPALATSTSKHQRDAYRVQFEILLRHIYHDIPASALTIDDRDTLHLPAHDTVVTPIGKPTVAPVVTVDKIAHLQHTLRFQNPETPDSHAKPDGVASVEIYGYATTKDVAPMPIPTPTPSEENFHHIAGTGKFLYTVEFPLTDVGKTVYYYARYRNAKGEVGPDSVMVNAVVA